MIFCCRKEKFKIVESVAEEIFQFKLSYETTLRRNIVPTEPNDETAVG